MKRLEKIVLVQYFVCDAEELDISGNTAFLGPNGTGKTAFLDAIQVVMLGADLRHMRFNAKLATNDAGTRSLRDYCLGCYQPDKYRRDSAHTYIALVFRDDRSGEYVSAGVAMTATVKEEKHNLSGLFVVRGKALSLADLTSRAGEDMMPLPWSDFLARLRLLDGKDGVRVIHTDRPEAYVKELLAAIQPRGLNINSADFQKVFRKSMQLNHISDVSAFVRDFLVEEEKIDRAKAMGQIVEFERLHKQVIDVKEQISTLNDLAKAYRAIETQAKRAASAAGLKAVYDCENNARRMDELTDALAAKDAEIERTRDELSRAQEVHEAAREEHTRAEVALQSDPAARDILRHQDALKSLQARAAGQRRQLAARSSGIEIALSGLDPHATTGSLKADLAGARGKMASLTTAIDAGNLDAARHCILDTLKVLREFKGPMATAVFQSTQALESAKNDLEGERAAFNQQRKGRPSMPGHIARAIEELEGHGIDARPVCEDLLVSDPHWQAAIEAYMGTNLFSLRVPAGREDDAVRFIRDPRRNLWNVAIVQPEHVVSYRFDNSNRQLVGALIESSDPVSAAYAWMQFGKVCKVETETELRRNPQSMTADGLLSKGGTTKRLQLKAATELVMGRSHVHFDAASMNFRIEQAERAVTHAQQKLDAVSKASDRLAQANATAEGEAEVGSLFDAIADVLAEQLAAQRLMESIIDTGHIEGLQQLAREARERVEAAQRQVTALVGKEASIGQARNGQQAELDKIQAASGSLSAAQQQALDNAYYDMDMANEFRGQLDTEPGGGDRPYENRCTACQKIIEDAQGREKSATTKATERWTLYRSKYNVELDDDEAGWQQILQYANRERLKLTEVRLHEYEAQAAQAKRVAEESFRQDIAIRLREGIFRMQGSLRTINNILKTCPPFSNNERYQFTWDPVPEHRPLYNYITAVAADNVTTDLFDDGHGEMASRIVDMLRDRSSSTEKTPIDDFRLMFRFDLDITNDSGLSTSLSKRQGKGSNGEHLTPFYVIAAAALCHAYRIDQDNRDDGAALMVMDEAFEHIDEQNASTTARFISAMGLQMIMAAPESSEGKLMSFSNTIYKMDRFGPDLYFDPHRMTPEGQKLMLSDMPSEHPELITQRIASYAADEPSIQ